MKAADVIKQLNAHRAFDDVEGAHLAKTLAFVGAHADNFWRRSTLEGHITASAFVVNMEHSHALMLHHAALGKWLQPGGHIDDGDESPLQAAIREVREETGASVAPSAQADKRGGDILFDVDVHPIPERRKTGQLEPAHLHYDLRYLLVAHQSNVTLSEESFDFRWVRIAELSDGRAESGITRMAKKLLKA
jgi:8-oxo-dGTP pyrophosphatase MutT (NUDIX family)